MSTYLGRVRRVHTGWRAVPGKNLVVYDDAVVEARASALDGLAVTGLGMVARGQQAVAQAGAAKNADIGQLTPQELVGLHQANWLLPTSTITSATLIKRKLGFLTGCTRRLTLHTAAGDRVVDWEGQANPDQSVIDMLHRALGDRFTFQR